MAQVSDNVEPTSKLTEEELGRLVNYFDILIQMDQEQKQKAEQDENQ